MNNSIAAAHPGTPFLQARARSEAEQIEKVRGLSERVAIIPLLAEEPIGLERLAALTTVAPQLA